MVDASLIEMEIDHAAPVGAWSISCAASFCQRRRGDAGKCPTRPRTRVDGDRAGAATWLQITNAIAQLGNTSATRDAERAVAAFAPADKKDEILMLLRLDKGPFWNSSQSADGA